jgi:uncharacterized phiE125 gp8 family phage protein
MTKDVLRQIAAPSTEPVTLAEAKAHLKIDDTADDAMIVGYAAAAREYVELITGRRLLPQDWELRLARFPACGEIVLPYAPLLAYSESAALISFVTVDSAGTSTTVDADDYRVVMPAGPDAQRGRIAAVSGWPGIDPTIPDPVRVQFRCGYASVSAVPRALRAAVLLALGDLYANREAASIATVKDQPAFARLVAPYRLF